MATQPNTSSAELVFVCDKHSKEEAGTCDSPGMVCEFGDCEAEATHELRFVNGSKCTVGWWGYRPTAGDHDYMIYSLQNGEDIALVRNFNDANARLIAAAPRMYGALRSLLYYLLKDRRRLSPEVKKLFR